MASTIPRDEMMDGIGIDEEIDDAAQYRERARYLRRMAEATPPRPDRERLLVLAEQYEKLAASA
jgi:hypothetical protein